MVGCTSVSMRSGCRVTLDDIRKLAGASWAHAKEARGIWSRNKAKMDCVDQAQTLALASIAESLAVIAQLQLADKEDQ